jgi:soluble lytic murein transglycosylase
VKRRRVILISILLLLAASAFLFWREQVREQKFIPQIRAAAERYRVDPMLIKAVVWRETRFHPDVRGKSGEIGLMQLQEVAAQEWADAEHIPAFVHEQCFDPGTNTLAGTFYLGKLIRRYAQADDPLPYALAEYNAGRGNVLKWNSGPAATNSAVFIEQIGFPGTKAYVKSVLRHYAFYRLLNRIGV